MGAIADIFAARKQSLGRIIKMMVPLLVGLTFVIGLVVTALWNKMQARKDLKELQGRRKEEIDG